MRKPEGSQINQKDNVQDLDAVSVALKTHYGSMKPDDLKISQILHGQLQAKSQANFFKKSTAIEAKITLAKEVCQQKVLINSRKTDFRISKARIKKKVVTEKKHQEIVDAFNNKNKKILEERDQTMQKLKNFENWQKQWLNYMNLVIFIEKIASIRRASKYFIT